MSLESLEIKIIDTQYDLNRYCAHLRPAAYISIDTEFMRERSYWPQFCLAQIAPPLSMLEEAEAIKAAYPNANDLWLYRPALIDPMVKNLDLTPFYELLNAPHILKVFHAARQDLELFWHLTGKVPHPVFDTQLAASVIGYGDQIAYDNLVKQIMGQNIDKSARLTDWSLRPLPQRAAHYALGDVLYLGQIYENLHHEIHQKNRQSWVDEELAILNDPETYIHHPEQAYLRIKKTKGTQKFRQVLRVLAAWREEAAQKRDIPRGRILRDEQLIDLAMSAPQTKAEMNQNRSIPKNLIHSAYGQEILTRIQEALAVPMESWPEESTPKRINAHDKGALELLKLLLKLVALDSGVAARLIASSDDLEQLVHFKDQAPIYALKGWRKHIFGEPALQLLNGKLKIGLNENGTIETTII